MSPDGIPADLTRFTRFELGDLLIDVAENGTADDVRRLIAAGADPDHRHGPHELTPLMLAAKRGALDVVRALVESGADPNELVDEGGGAVRAALTFATSSKLQALYDYLRPLTSAEVLDATAPWDRRQRAKTDKRVTALVRSARQNSLDEVRAALAAGADVNATDRTGDTALNCAAATGNVELVNVLLAAGARADVCRPGAAPLFAGVGEEVIDALVRAGADPNARVTPDGATPLSVAANIGRVNEARALLARGARVNERDGEGATALLLAAERGHIAAVELLLAAGADVNLPHRSGRTPLMAALNHPTIVTRLLSAGADVNACAGDGDTALIRAAATGKLEMVKTLLARGADATAANALGRTALILTRNTGIAQALLAAGTPIDAQDSRGRTALMYAATRGDLPIAKVLLSSGADTTLRDAEGKSAAELAARGFTPADAEIASLLGG